jgi:hypothetical protein
MHGADVSVDELLGTTALRSMPCIMDCFNNSYSFTR